MQALFTTSDVDWVVDSSASKHMSGTRSAFSSMSSSVSAPSVTIANGIRSPVHGQENVSLLNNLTFCDVPYVPNFPVNLLSVSQLTKTHHCAVTLFPTYLLIQVLRTGKRIGLGPESNGLYCLSGRRTPKTSAYIASTSESPFLWHCCIGHLSLDKLKSLLPKSVSINNFQCESCQLGKHRRSSYPPC